MRSILAGLAAALCMLAPTSARADGPPLSVPAEQLQAALRCPSAFTHLAHEPVLLVHGTGVDAATNWGWNYLRALTAAGFDVCTVDLPGDSLGDIQMNAEYVVGAVRRMRAATNRKVDVIGHSQGPLEVRWAIKWWPDVRAAVDDLVSLSGANHGLPLANALCVLACDAALWQFRSGSAFLRALNAGDETPGGVDQTSVVSLTDELIVPASTAPLEGAANIIVQKRCPLRVTGHLGMLYDAVVYAIVLDALTHPGPARIARVSPAVCLRGLLPKLTYTEVALRDVALAGRFALGLITHQKLTAEPPLRLYVSD